MPIIDQAVEKPRQRKENKYTLAVRSKGPQTSAGESRYESPGE